jgi:hypothetical protein
MAWVVIDNKWFNIRVNSQKIILIYLERNGIVIFSNFSIARE